MDLLTGVGVCERVESFLDDAKLGALPLQPASVLGPLQLQSPLKSTAVNKAVGGAVNGFTSRHE